MSFQSFGGINSTFKSFCLWLDLRQEISNLTFILSATGTLSVSHFANQFAFNAFRYSFRPFKFQHFSHSSLWTRPLSQQRYLAFSPSAILGLMESDFSNSFCRQFIHLRHFAISNTTFSYSAIWTWSLSNSVFQFAFKSFQNR